MIGMLQGIIWPAIAGNVLWAFITVSTRDSLSALETWIRIGVLILLGIYLLAQWKHTENIRFKSDREENKFSASYIWLDSILAVAIATFAIMTDSKHYLAPYSLGAVFLAALVGHAFGIWSQAAKCKRRSYMAGVHTIGIITLGFALCQSAPIFSIPMLVATAVVVGLWVLSNCSCMKMLLDK